MGRRMRVECVAELDGAALDARLTRMTPAELRALDALLLAPDVFRTTYRDDPVGFARDCIAWPPGQALRGYQAEALTLLATRRRAAIRGPHGPGKTTIAALACLWFAFTRDGDPHADWKIITTAGSWLQLTRYLWPEIHKWARRLRWDRLGRGPLDERTEFLDSSLKLTTGQAFAAASDKPELLEGGHASHLLYVFDEAKAIRDATFDAAEGALMGEGEALALALSTPGAPAGRFYAIHARRPGYEDWGVRHITLAENLVAGGILAAEVAQRQAQWGETSAVYQNRVLGEFASQDEASVIPLAWVEAANERWRVLEAEGFATTALDYVGVDVGLQADRTVQALRVGAVITALRRAPHQDTMATAGTIATILRGYGGRAIVDADGIGAGVFHRLREQGLPVVAFHAAGGTDATDRSGELRFVNLRAAAWWALRERLDPTSGEALALPPDDLLTGDLTAPRWRITSSGKIQIEEKAEIRKRLGRSTDDGDAVVMAFADVLVRGTPVGASAEIRPTRESYHALVPSVFGGRGLSDVWRRRR